MNRIKELREEKNFDQKKLGEKLNIGKGSISNWEVERTEPNIYYLSKMADLFGVSIDYLLGREDYGTGNVEIKGELLSNTEHELIIIFRRLPEKEKYRALGIIQGLAS